MGNSTLRTDTNQVADAISRALRLGGGSCVALHGGAAYAEIPDPTGRSGAIPVLLTIRVRSNAQAAYDGYMEHTGYVPDDIRGILRESFLMEGMPLPPELLDDR